MIKELRIAPTQEGYEFWAFFRADLEKMPTKVQLGIATREFAERALDALAAGDAEKTGFSHGKTPTWAKMEVDAR